MSVRILVVVTSYAEEQHLVSYRTVDVESVELERLLKLGYGERQHANVIGAELLPATAGVDSSGEVKHG